GGRLLDRAVHAADAGRIARSERLFARAGQAERLASDLSRASLVNRAWTAYRINSISGFSLRMVDKAALDPSHDPTKGWRPYEPTQLQAGNVFFTAVGLPVGGLIRGLSDGAADGVRLLAGRMASAAT